MRRQIFLRRSRRTNQDCYRINPKFYTRVPIMNALRHKTIGKDQQLFYSIFYTQHVTFSAFLPFYGNRAKALNKQELEFFKYIHVYIYKVHAKSYSLLCIQIFIFIFIFLCILQNRQVSSISQSL